MDIKEDKEEEGTTKDKKRQRTGESKEFESVRSRFVKIDQEGRGEGDGLIGARTVCTICQR
jgi:hypothetical protein